jgi:hypothetical protein
MDKSLITRFEVKESDEDARTFSGLAATWDLDLGGDVIKQGAFKRTLGLWKKSKRPLPLIDSHNDFSVRNVVGKLVEAEETSEGLEASFEMIDGPDGEEVFRRVKGGYVDGLSIGYQAVKVKYPDTEEEQAAGIYRYLEEIKLREISVVLWPMQPNARIDTSSMKAMMMDLVKGDRDLEPEEVAELKRLHGHLTSILAGVKTDDDLPPQMDPKQLENLKNRISGVMSQRLATRIETVRHSSHDLIEI